MSKQRLPGLYLAFAFLLFASLSRAQQSEDLDAIVTQFYPSSIDSELASIGAQDVVLHEQCFVILESVAEGSAQSVLAAHTNHYFGAVRVLARGPSGSFGIVAESQDGLLGGDDCEASATDIDRDGRKEALVAFGRRRNSSDWVYRWRNGVLSNLTPSAGVSPGLEAISGLINSRFVDIDGDGTLELYSAESPLLRADPSEPVISPPARVFRLAGDSFVLDRPVVLVTEFNRDSSTPATKTISVKMPTGAIGPLTIRIANGSGAAAAGNRVENAVESGRIWFNGQQIVEPNDFGQQVGTITRTVEAGLQNELSVRLAGAPGGRITVVIDAASWAP